MPRPDPTPADPHHLALGPRLAVGAVARTLQAWLATLQLTLSPAEEAAFRDTRDPLVFLLWHNQLLLTPLLATRFRPHRPVHGLVSASRDGAWLAALFQHFHIGVVRGSSSRLGREALEALIATLRRGEDVCLTPDGPRGPAYRLEAGALVAARRANAALLLLGLQLESAWRVNSWDGFLLPRPFSAVRLRVQRIGPEQLRTPAASPAAVEHTLQEWARPNEVRLGPVPRLRSALPPGPPARAAAEAASAAL